MLKDGTRLVVDCAKGDTSSVFHVGMLDDEHQRQLREKFPDKPWLFDADEQPISAWATQEKACACQRAYRRACGCDPLTGERLAITKDQAIEALAQTALDAVSMVGYANYSHREVAAKAAIRASAETGKYIDPESKL